MHQQYQYPQHDYQQSHQPGASFGADPPLAPIPDERLSNLWQGVKLWTPSWLKESVTISLGVFGGMALFRMFQRKLPKPVGTGV